MAQADDEDDTLDLTEELEDGPDDEEDSGDETDEGDDPDAGEEDEEETVVSFGEGDEEDVPDDNSVIRRMRAELKESKKRIAELEQASPAPATIEVGEKPTLAGCNYDEDAYEAEVDKWRERKAEAERAEAEQQEQARAANEAWQSDLQAYEQKKAKLALPDYEAAEDAVKGSLSLVQQAVIIKAAGDPALFVAAIGRNDAKLAELAKIADPIKLAATVARMEGAIKVSKKRKGPAIDKPQGGSGSMPQGQDKELEKLEKEAERTGNRTKLIAYKKSKGIK